MFIEYKIFLLDELFVRVEGSWKWRWSGIEKCINFNIFKFALAFVRNRITLFASAACLFVLREKLFNLKYFQRLFNDNKVRLCNWQCHSTWKSEITTRTTTAMKTNFDYFNVAQLHCALSQFSFKQYIEYLFHLIDDKLYILHNNV